MTQEEQELREALKSVMEKKIQPMLNELVVSISDALCKAYFEGVEVGLIKGHESKGLVEDDD